MRIVIYSLMTTSVILDTTEPHLGSVGKTKGPDIFLLVYVHLSVGTSNIIFFAWAQQFWTCIYENLYTELNNGKIIEEFLNSLPNEFKTGG